MKDKNSRPLSSWIELLKDRILVSGVDDPTAAALCGHLADLGILERTDGEGWKLTGSVKSSLNVEQEMEKRLKDLCADEKGFALHYFMKDASSSQTDDTQHQAPSESEGKSGNNPELLSHKTSNLSNLQIVKKYGRQVQSFVELEKSYTEKLLGPNTASKEARRIFNFILSRMKQKTEPRPWEQLSRRRHK